MELITTHICKTFELGIHENMFGGTMMSLIDGAGSSNVYTGNQDVVTHTNIKFVRIDDEGNAIPISERVKMRYFERIKQFGKGLLSNEEKIKFKL